MDVSFGEPMNHKLRVLVRVDADPGHVTLEVAGCLTRASYPALLHIMRRASRLAAGSDTSIDLPRGPNKLWTQGGLIYALPMR